MTPERFLDLHQSSISGKQPVYGYEQVKKMLEQYSATQLSELREAADELRDTLVLADTMLRYPTKPLDESSMSIINNALQKFQQLKK